MNRTLYSHPHSQSRVHHRSEHLFPRRVEPAKRSLWRFVRNQRIQGIRARLSSDPFRLWTLLRRLSKLLSTEELGNSPGWKGSCARVQVCVANGHSKSMWFTVSSSCPRR
ncbi:unnamed protein product [Brassica oleracea var. botrytis]